MNIQTQRIKNNLHKIVCTEDPQGEDPPPVLWASTVALRDDQDVAVVAQEMQENWEQRGNPTDYVQTPEQILEETRREKVNAVRNEGLRRIQEVEPGIKGFDELKLVVDIWPGLDTAQLGADIILAKDVYVAAKNAITWINDPARTQAQLDASTIEDVNWP